MGETWKTNWLNEKERKEKLDNKPPEGKVKYVDKQKIKERVKERGKHFLDIIEKKNQKIKKLKDQIQALKNFIKENEKRFKELQVIQQGHLVLIDVLQKNLEALEFNSVSDTDSESSILQK